MLYNKVAQHAHEQVEQQPIRQWQDRIPTSSHGKMLDVGLCGKHCCMYSTLFSLRSLKDYAGITRKRAKSITIGVYSA